MIRSLTFRTTVSSRARLLFFASTIVISIALEGCGLAENAKPIPPGTPLAVVHFGPVNGLGQALAINVQDNEECSRSEFSRNKALGAISGRELDLEVPAGKRMYVAIDAIASGGYCAPPFGGGVCISLLQCKSRVSFEPRAGGTYSAQLLSKDKKCGTFIFEVRDGHKELVPGQENSKLCGE
jgi:hypothetical protein